MGLAQCGECYFAILHVREIVMQPMSVRSSHASSCCRWISFVNAVMPSGEPGSFQGVRLTLIGVCAQPSQLAGPGCMGSYTEGVACS